MNRVNDIEMKTTEARAVALALSARNTKLLLRAIAAESVTPGRFMLMSRYDADWHNEQVRS